MVIRYSVWDDTEPDQIAKAAALSLPIYTAVDKLQDEPQREKCDCIRNMIPITICNTEVFGVKGEHWRNDYWGHMMLKPIRVNDCR
jgi:hypothetical protein